MAKINLTESEKSLEITTNGINKCYPIAKRTGALEKKLIEYQDKLAGMTEYEKYKSVISLILGEDAYAELFPLGEEESLDKMAQIAYHAQKEFNADIDALNKKKLSEELENSGIDLASEKLKQFNDSVDATIRKGNTLQKGKQK